MRFGSRRFWWRVLLVVLSVLVTGFIAAAIFIRWVETQPMCTGESGRSPNGLYGASVMECFDPPFFRGETRHYFEFSVSGPGVNHFLTSTAIPGPYFGSRSSHQVIFWDEKPAAVRFVFPSAELRFETRPDINRFEALP